MALDLAGSERIREKVKGDLFAGLLYAALCNNEWRHRRANETWGCTWRSAGDVVTGLRGEGDYLDWYCWGHEGVIDEVVLAELEALGWRPVTMGPTPVLTNRDRLKVLPPGYVKPDKA